MVSTGELIAGRYQLEDVVGEGGMSVVYRATDSRLGREVAVKILRGQFVFEPGATARFRHEARAAASLSHPNVVSVYDWGVEGDVQYLVMEFVDGPSLEELLRRRGRLPPYEAARIAASAAAGLEVAHQRGIVHRDVKPGNILLDRAGRVRVADFGIARVVGSTAVTLAGTVLGSVPYLSPEQALGEEVMPASDIYSLGVVLFQMLTGERPFAGSTAAETAVRRVHAPPPVPSEVAPGIPAPLDGIVLRALARDPAERYGSARDMEVDLERWLRDAARKDPGRYSPRGARVDAPVTVFRDSAAVAPTMARPPGRTDAVTPAKHETQEVGRAAPSGSVTDADADAAVADPPAAEAEVAGAAVADEGAADAGAGDAAHAPARGPEAPTLAASPPHAGGPEDAATLARAPRLAPSPRPSVPVASTPAAPAHAAGVVRVRPPLRRGSARRHPDPRAIAVLAALAALVAVGVLASLVSSGFRLSPGGAATPTQVVAGLSATPAPSTRAPGPVPSPSATPKATPSPTPTPLPPPTAAATAAVPPAAAPPVPGPVATPDQVVADFYSLVAAHRFADAAALWSPSMRERYPPATYIDGRFADTTGISLRRDRLVAEQGDAASVAVDLVEYRDVSPTVREFVGSWDLVRIGGRWLMDQPHF